MKQTTHHIRNILFRSSTVFFVVCVTILPTLAFGAEDSLFGVGAAMGTFFAELGGALFSLAGIFFDKVLQVMVLGIGVAMQGSLGDTITLVWSVIRDVSNLVFIFMFLYIGIRLILSITSISEAKRVITMTIIAALLINFSLFFTKAIIDVSNVATIATYNLIAPQEGVSIGLQVAHGLGIHTYFDPGRVTSEDLVEYKASGIFAGFLMMIFFIVAALVFFVATIMLVVRYAILLLTMIFSPLMLLLLIVPNIPATRGLVNFAKNGRDKFIASAFYPVIFLFLIYVTIRIMGTYTNTVDFTSLYKNDADRGPIVLFLLGIVLLLYALKSANMVSNHAARATTAGAMAGGAWIGRQTVGRGSQQLMAGSFGQALRSERNQQGIRGIGARATLRGLRTTAGGTYDVRASRAYKKAAETQLGKDIGIGNSTKKGFGVIGVGEGGYEARKKAAVEAEKKRAEEEAALLRDEGLVNKRKGELVDAEKARMKSSEEYREAHTTIRVLNDQRKEAVRRHGKDSEEVKAIDTQLDQASDELTKVKKDYDDKKQAAQEAKDKLKEAETVSVVGTKAGRENIKQAKTVVEQQERIEKIKKLEKERDKARTKLADPKISREERQKNVDKIHAAETEIAKVRKENEEKLAETTESAKTVATLTETEKLKELENQISTNTTVHANESNPAIRNRLEEDQARLMREKRDLEQQKKTKEESIERDIQSHGEDAVTFRNARKKHNEQLRQSGGVSGRRAARGVPQSWARGTTQETQQKAGEKLAPRK